MNFGLLLNQIIWGLLVGVSYSLLAIGFSVIYATSDAINFAQGEYAMLGAYFCFTISSKLNVNVLIGVVIAVILILLFGSAVERVAFRRLYKLEHIFIVICTIGLSTMLKNLVLIIWGPDYLSLPFPIKFEPINVLGVIIQPNNLIILAVGILIMIAFHLFMTKTKTGTAMRAVAQNKSAASLMGINVKRSINLTWGLGAFIAGVGGILVGFVYNLSIDMGSLIGIKGFASAIIGGFGNIVGAMFGGLILGVAENTSAYLISYYYKDLISFLIIIIILIIKPTGLFIRGRSFRKV
jgi:branched-chain amino acid transport system permease protein